MLHEHFGCMFLQSLSTTLPVSCLFSLLLIGGAADLETSDFAKVAKIFYNLALKVRTAQHSFHSSPLSNWIFFLHLVFSVSDHTEVKSVWSSLTSVTICFTSVNPSSI